MGFFRELRSLGSDLLDIISDTKDEVSSVIDEAVEDYKSDPEKFISNSIDDVADLTGKAANAAMDVGEKALGVAMVVGEKAADVAMDVGEYAIKEGIPNYLETSNNHAIDYLNSEESANLTAEQRQKMESTIERTSTYLEGLEEGKDK